MEDPLGPEPPDAPDAAPGPPDIDSARYRQVLGHFATGVVVITSHDDEGPAGLAVNSFTSVSLAPPLVAFCAAATSTTWPRIQSTGRYCVNVLAEHQEDLCRLFATRGADKFEGIGWTRSGLGSPVLAGALAWIDCVIDAEHKAGDHLIVVGGVRELGLSEDAGPLLFYRGGYGRLGS
ncbi:MAG: flavin reductase family protein [Acidimicrobiales bacterium]